ILETIGRTPLVELQRFSPRPGVRLFAKLEGQNPTGSVKDRIAKYMVERAEREGRLKPGGIIMEPTSGNTGIALAMIARRKGYRMVAVMPESVSVERRMLLEAFGAEVVLTEGQKGSNGAIEVAQRLAEEHPEYYMPYQYGNPANPEAHYETTGVEILEDLPEVDVFVAGLGTGGTLMGVGRRLKEVNPRVQVVAAEPHPGDLVQGLRSLDEGFVPPILDLDLLDRKIVVHSEDAARLTRELLVREGIFAGISSGAALHAALRVAQRMQQGNIVVLMADGGWKYLSTRLWTQDIERVGEELRSKVWL
ncbi:MAG TPA: cysteine synthase family protein, partial [Chloroflexota bacterium]